MTHFLIEILLTEPRPILDVNRYVLPASFGLTIDRKLKQMLTLNNQETNEMVRILCLSFLEHTHAPNADELRVVIDRLFKKHDSLIFRNKQNVKDVVASTVICDFLASL